MNLIEQLKNLTDRKNKSAVISIRVTPELKQNLKEIADKKGKTISELFLEALKRDFEHQLGTTAPERK